MAIEVLVAAMWQNDLTFHQKMNLQCNTVIANQCNKWDYQEKEYEYGKVRMLSTNTRGVGVNRNFCLNLAESDILLFADEDIEYYDSDLKGVIEAFEQFPEADVIFFDLDLVRDGEIYKKMGHGCGRVRFYEVLKYGTPYIAIKKQICDKYSLSFSHLFGGGAQYGCGEDSLFVIDCMRNRLKMYSHSYVLGKCAKDSSSWFTGYNEKYLYDKGAWIACAFPKIKHLIKWYFVYRFAKKSGFSFAKTAKIMNKGISGFKTLATYDQIKNSI